jgi:hypothetical protein
MAAEFGTQGLRNPLALNKQHDPDDRQQETAQAEQHA